jgi:hypothetical protein
MGKVDYRIETFQTDNKSTSIYLWIEKEGKAMMMDTLPGEKY